MSNKEKKTKFKSPAHRIWHRKVEGQLKCVMKAHPEWFTELAKREPKTFTFSVAKRIVGEIVAMSLHCGNITK